MDRVWVKFIESCPTCGVTKHDWVKWKGATKKSDINEYDEELSYQPKPWCDCNDFSGTVKKSNKVYELDDNTLLVMDEIPSASKKR